MAVVTQALTATELLRLPRGHTHGKVAARFTARLAPFVEEHGLGETYAAETGFLLRSDPDTVRAPDVAFVSAERIAATVQSPEGYFPGPPDLAVEVVSPFDTYTEVEEKVAERLEAGTRVVVVVDPRRRTAAVHRSRAGIEVLGAKGSLTIPDLLPGWSAALAEIFK